MRTVVKMKAASLTDEMSCIEQALRLWSHQKSKILRSQGNQNTNGFLKKEKTMMHWTVVFVE